MPVKSDLAALLPRVGIGVLYPTNCVVLCFGAVRQISPRIGACITEYQQN